MHYYNYIKNITLDIRYNELADHNSFIIQLFINIKFALDFPSNITFCQQENKHVRYPECKILLYNIYIFCHARMLFLQPVTVQYVAATFAKKNIYYIK